MKHYHVFLLILSTVFLPSCAQFQKRSQSVPIDMFMILDQDTASRFAQLALQGIQREYPNKPGHVMNNAGEVRNPAALHPAFYGSFDWHSSVHGHWMLVRLLKLFPQLPEANAIRQALRMNPSLCSSRPTYPIAQTPRLSTSTV